MCELLLVTSVTGHLVRDRLEGSIPSLVVSLAHGFTGFNSRRYLPLVLSHWGADSPNSSLITDPSKRIKKKKINPWCCPCVRGRNGRDMTWPHARSHIIGTGTRRTYLYAGPICRSHIPESDCTHLIHASRPLRKPSQLHRRSPRDLARICTNRNSRHISVLKTVTFGLGDDRGFALNDRKTIVHSKNSSTTRRHAVYKK
ncbi:hypothetical protein EDB87DRAFT_592513 [Lactarius vividus]|nr:hypothetical protein EDB87DRAFT_592513 [Lactarius vividus]